MGFLLTIPQQSLQLVECQASDLKVDNSFWLQLATNAWNYFQPGVGVDKTTGLHSSGLYYPYFTDWDLGNYVQAIIDATKLGIIKNTGTWGSDARFNMIISFLESRQLSPSGVPYVWYQSANGQPYGSTAQECTDAAELLASLYSLKIFEPNLAASIDYIVYNRTNYAPLMQAVNVLVNSTDLGDYHAASGFACFWPSQFSSLADNILSNILSAPTISTYGVALPISKLMCEPLFLSVFNFPANAELNNLAKLMYLAQQARYTATGQFTAFTEGNSGLSNPTYVYEWVIKQNGATWAVEDSEFNPVTISPIIFFKAAVGMLAMFDSSFTENMVSYIESNTLAPTDGYCEGINQNKQLDSAIVGNTNSMIIQAAEYAVSTSNQPSPTPTSSSSPNPSVSPTSHPTPSPVQSTSPTPTSRTSPSPSVSSTNHPTPTPIQSTSPTPSASNTPTTTNTPSTSNPSTSGQSSTIIETPIQSGALTQSSSPATTNILTPPAFQSENPSKTSSVTQEPKNIGQNISVPTNFIFGFILISIIVAGTLFFKKFYRPQLKENRMG
jgi:hypothetical protein